LSEIHATRAQGIGYDRGELDPDVRCIAVPVLDFAGRTFAAMGVSAPAWRMAPVAVDEKLRVLKDAALELSALLGSKGRVGPQNCPQSDPIATVCSLRARFAMVDVRNGAASKVFRLLLDGAWVDGKRAAVPVLDKFRLAPFASVTLASREQVTAMVDA